MTVTHHYFSLYDKTHLSTLLSIAEVHRYVTYILSTEKNRNGRGRMRSPTSNYKFCNESRSSYGYDVLASIFKSVLYVDDVIRFPSFLLEHLGKAVRLTEVICFVSVMHLREFKSRTGYLRQFLLNILSGQSGLNGSNYCIKHQFLIFIEVWQCHLKSVHAAATCFASVASARPNYNCGSIRSGAGSP